MYNTTPSLAIDPRFPLHKYKVKERWSCTSGHVETAVSTGDRVETAVSCEPQCYNCGTSCG